MKRLVRRMGAFLAVAVWALLVAPSVHAEAFWDKPSLLKDFFAKSERVTVAKLALTAAQQQAVRKRLGVDVPAPWTVYYGKTGERIDGVAVIDNELGQHEPITFAVLMGVDGALKRLEVMVYREAYGSEVREDRFRKQFVGKTAADPLRHGADIVAIAGATISSKSMANGARRVMVVADEVLLKPGLVKVLTAAEAAKAKGATP